MATASHAPGGRGRPGRLGVPSRRRTLARLLFLAVGLCWPAAPLQAQEPDTLFVGREPGTQPALQEEAPMITPGRVFLRALLVPGWGHASIGEYTRGGFYFLTEAGAAWMVARNVVRLRAARATRDFRETEVALALGAVGVTDPAEVAAAQTADPLVTDARALVEARGQQVEDWLALGLFLVLLSGVDAFVSAHLMDFPDPVGVEIRPTAEGLGIEFSVPWGGGGRRR